LVNSVFFYVLFPVLVHSIKERVETERRENKLKINRVIKINNHEAGSILYVEENEIIYEGRLYDIVYKKVTRNHTEFYCYLDVEEETAYRTVGDLAKRNFELKINDLSIPFYTGMTCNSFSLNNPSTRIYTFSVLNHLYLNAIPEIPDPPPNLFS
jgi:hypothetical protein